MSAEVLGLLRELVAGQREMLAELRGLREIAETERGPARSLRHSDRIAMVKILPVLAAHFQGTFASWELLDYAGAGDALAANLRLVIRKRTARQLGMLFARAAGHDVDGLTLRRRGQDANGALWECVGNRSSFPRNIPEPKLSAF